jgi:hypothetical protein
MNPARNERIDATGGSSAGVFTRNALIAEDITSVFGWRKIFTPWSGYSGRMDGGFPGFPNFNCNMPMHEGYAPSEDNYGIDIRTGGGEGLGFYQAFDKPSNLDGNSLQAMELSGSSNHVGALIRNDIARNSGRKINADMVEQFADDSKSQFTGSFLRFLDGKPNLAEARAVADGTIVEIGHIFTDSPYKQAYVVVKHDEPLYGMEAFTYYGGLYGMMNIGQYFDTGVSMNFWDSYELFPFEFKFNVTFTWVDTSTGSPGVPFQVTYTIRTSDDNPEPHVFGNIGEYIGPGGIHFAGRWWSAHGESQLISSHGTESITSLEFPPVTYHIVEPITVAQATQYEYYPPELDDDSFVGLEDLFHTTVGNELTGVPSYSLINNDYWLPPTFLNPGFGSKYNLLNQEVSFEGEYPGCDDDECVKFSGFYEFETLSERNKAKVILHTAFGVSKMEACIFVNEEIVKPHPDKEGVINFHSHRSDGAFRVEKGQFLGYIGGGLLDPGAGQKFFGPPGTGQFGSDAFWEYDAFVKEFEVGVIRNTEWLRNRSLFGRAHNPTSSMNKFNELVGDSWKNEGNANGPDELNIFPGINSFTDRHLHFRTYVGYDIYEREDWRTGTQTLIGYPESRGRGVPGIKHPRPGARPWPAVDPFLYYSIVHSGNGLWHSQLRASANNYAGHHGKFYYSLTGPIAANNPQTMLASATLGEPIVNYAGFDNISFASGTPMPDPPHRNPSTAHELPKTLSGMIDYIFARPPTYSNIELNFGFRLSLIFQIFVFPALGAVVIVWAIFLGLQFGLAQDEAKRGAAKKRLVGALASIFIVVICFVTMTGITLSPPSRFFDQSGTGGGGGGGGGSDSDGSGDGQQPTNHEPTAKRIDGIETITQGVNIPGHGWGEFQVTRYRFKCPVCGKTVLQNSATPIPTCSG